MRRWVPGLGLAAVLVSSWGVVPLSAQEALLERWSLGHLAETWSPRWGMPEVGSGFALALSENRDPLLPPPVAWVSAGFEVLSLRETLYRDRSEARLGVRLPVGASVGLQLSATTGSWATERAGRPVFTTPRSEAVSLGVDGGFDLASLGELRLVAIAGWDNGAGGIGRLVSGSRYHSFVIEGWLTTSRPSSVSFPADSLRELGVGHDLRGGEIRVELNVPISSVALRPSAAWKRELVDETDDVTTGFLTTTPEGGHTVLDFGLDVEWGPWAAGAGYRERTSHMRGTFMRGTEQAGFVALADYDFWSWRARVGRRIGARRWVVEGGSEDLGGVLGARVETWPFVSLWESLSAIAYRLNGDVDARSQWVRLLSRTEDGRGWSWGVEVGRYTMEVARDSWYVTSFGFGRSDRQMTTQGADPAVFVGGEVAKAWSTGLGDVGVRLKAGAPVHVTSLDGGGPAGQGMAGYLGVGLEWVRR